MDPNLAAPLTPGDTKTYSVLATHLTPAAGEPLHLACAGPIVTRCSLFWPVVPAAFQRQAADVVGHAHHCASPHASPALG